MTKLNKNLLFGFFFLLLGFLSNVLIHLFYSLVRINFASYGFNEYIQHSELIIQYNLSRLFIILGFILIVINFMKKD